MNKSAIIIPSHLGAKRLPNKPLLEISGKPMIVHVWERAIKSEVKDVFVATANKEIVDVIKSCGGNAVLTGTEHTTGSDRIYEAIKNLNLRCDFIINVQGDMPNINPDTINMLNQFMITNNNAEVATVASDISSEETLDQNVVKAITSSNLKENGFQIANDFVRKIEKQKYFYHHVGLYSYKLRTLESFVNLSKTKNEIERSLEQMRFLDHDIDIFVGYTKDNPLSVDTKEDLEKIRKLI